MFLSKSRIFLTFLDIFHYTESRLTKRGGGLMSKKTEILTPRQYISKYSTNKSSFEAVKIIPPKVGQKGFGKIAVIRKDSSYNPPAK